MFRELNSQPKFTSKKVHPGCGMQQEERWGIVELVYQMENLQARRTKELRLERKMVFKLIEQLKEHLTLGGLT